MSTKSSRTIRKGHQERKHTQHEEHGQRFREQLTSSNDSGTLCCRLATLPRQHLNAASRVFRAQRITSAKRRQQEHVVGQQRDATSSQRESAAAAMAVAALLAEAAAEAAASAAAAPLTVLVLAKTDSRAK